MFLREDTNPSDCRFLGEPIDYIIFKGATEIREGRADAITKVIFIDVKTNKGSLTKIQRRIRDAIQAGRVEFEVMRIEGEENA